MTIKEAIKELKGLQEFINGTRLKGEVRVEAFDLAIKALEDVEIMKNYVKPCYECKYRPDRFG